MEGSKNDINRSSEFLNNLYEEKIKHKEHRHQFVKNKLLFIISLFSIGSLKNIGGDFNINLSILLYFIPIVALSYDVYIFSEDFKVKRIGVFIRNYCDSKCNDENKWENWLTISTNRENLALIASLALTIIAFFASLMILLMFNEDPFIFNLKLLLWFISCSLLIAIVFVYALHRRNKLLGRNKNQNIIQQ